MFNLDELVTQHLVIMSLKLKLFLKTENAENAPIWPEFFNDKHLNCNQTQECPANDFSNPVQPRIFSFEFLNLRGTFYSSPRHFNIINTMTMKRGG